MPKFNLDEYELVEDRLKKFWKDNKNGRINTDVVSSSEDGTMVIVKAELYADKEDVVPVSTGLAQETKGLGGFANKEAWLENAESSAIGRALANWKYQGNKKPRPTQEEMKKVTETKKPAPKPSQSEQEKMEAVVEEMVNPTKSVADQINEILYGDGYKNLGEDSIKDYKKAAYNMVVGQGFPTDVNEWDNNQMSIFFEMFDLQVNNPEEDIVKEVFGEVIDKKFCPECKESEYLEDNREKKESDSKYAKIPDFACSNYGDNKGCGKGWYIGNEDFPTGWI